MLMMEARKERNRRIKIFFINKVGDDE